MRPAEWVLALVLLAGCSARPMQQVKSANDEATLQLARAQGLLEMGCDDAVWYAALACSDVEGSDLACYEAKRDKVAAVCLKAAGALSASGNASEALDQAATGIDSVQTKGHIGELGLRGLSAYQYALEAVNEVRAIVSGGERP